MFGIGAMEILVLLMILLLIGVPIVVAIVIISKSAGKSQMNNPNLTPCPDCHKFVSINATTCPHCGRVL